MSLLTWLHFHVPLYFFSVSCLFGLLFLLYGFILHEVNICYSHILMEWFFSINFFFLVVSLGLTVGALPYQNPLRISYSVPAGYRNIPPIELSPFLPLLCYYLHTYNVYICSKPSDVLL